MNKPLNSAAYYITAIILLLSSCADTDRYIYNGEDSTLLTYDEALAQWEATLASASFVEATDAVPTDENDDLYDDYLENQQFTRRVDIVYTADTAYVTTTQSSDQVGISVSGAHVKLNLDRKKLLISLSGETNDGSLKIYSENKFQLMLNGVSITSLRGSAINIQSKKRTFLTLVQGTTNTLSDATLYTDTIAGEDEKGCFFSEGQVIMACVNSDGTVAPNATTTNALLTIKGNALHALATDEYLFVHPGVRLDITKAAKDAIHTNEGLRMTGGLVRAYAQKDAIQADTLGIEMTGGWLYSYGKRAYTADPVNVTLPARFVPLSN